MKNRLIATLFLLCCFQISIAADTQKTLNEDILQVLVNKLKESDHPTLHDIYKNASTINRLKIASKKNLLLKTKLSDFYTKNHSNTSPPIIAVTLGKKREKILTAIELDKSFPFPVRQDRDFDQPFTMLLKGDNVLSYFSNLLLNATAHQEQLRGSATQMQFYNLIDVITGYYKDWGYHPFYRVTSGIHPSYSTFIDQVIANQNTQVLLHMQNSIWPFSSNHIERIKNCLADPNTPKNKKSDISYFMSRAVDMKFFPPAYDKTPSRSCSLM